MGLDKYKLLIDCVWNAVKKNPDIEVQALIARIESLSDSEIIEAKEQITREYIKQHNTI